MNNCKNKSKLYLLKQVFLIEFFLVYWNNILCSAWALLVDILSRCPVNRHLYRSHGYLLTLFHPRYIHTYLPIHIRRETAENISINQDNNTTIRKWCFVTKLNNLPKKQEARTHSYRQLGLHKQGKNTSSKETDWGFPGLILRRKSKARQEPTLSKSRQICENNNFVYIFIQIITIYICTYGFISKPR